MLARGEREPQLVGHRIGGRRGARATDRAGLARGVEPVPVPAVGPQAIDFDVHGVGPVGRGDGRAAADDLGHCFVFGDLPGDLDRLGGHAAAFERLGREARPEHEAVGRGIARGDAELERIVGDLDASLDGAVARDDQTAAAASDAVVVKNERRETDDGPAG